MIEQVPYGLGDPLLVCPSCIKLLEVAFLPHLQVGSSDWRACVIYQFLGWRQSKATAINLFFKVTPCFRQEQFVPYIIHHVDMVLTRCGHTCVFIPKFHCKLNPIERMWSQSKRYTRAHCDYTIASLQRNIPLALQSVSAENIANYVRRCRNYMFAYLEGSAVGVELEEKIKLYKSVSYTLHRRVGIND